MSSALVATAFGLGSPSSIKGDDAGMTSARRPARAGHVGPTSRRLSLHPSLTDLTKSLHLRPGEGADRVRFLVDR